MDVHFELKGVSFVWDHEKVADNPVKHDGITFEQAAQMFFDPLDFTRFSRQFSTSSLKLLEVHRAQLVEMAVPANAIVETLDVIKHI